MTEDEVVGWHHQLNGHEFEQTPGDSEGQGSVGAVVCGFAESIHTHTHSLLNINTHTLLNIMHTHTLTHS